MSGSWQAFRLPTNTFESEQHMQVGMPGRNDGMKILLKHHRLCTKCNQACSIVSVNLGTFKSLEVQTSTEHPVLKAEVQQSYLWPKALLPVILTTDAVAWAQMGYEKQRTRPTSVAFQVTLFPKDLRGKHSLRTFLCEIVFGNWHVKSHREINYMWSGISDNAAKMCVGT